MCDYDSGNSTLSEEEEEEVVETKPKLIDVKTTAVKKKVDVGKYIQCQMVLRQVGLGQNCICTDLYRH